MEPVQDLEAWYEDYIMREKPPVGALVRWDEGLLGRWDTRFGMVTRHTPKQIRIDEFGHVSEPVYGDGLGCEDKRTRDPDVIWRTGLVGRYNQEDGWAVYIDGRSYSLALDDGSPGRYVAYY